MKCQGCTREFNPFDNAKAGGFPTDLEISVTCPHCRTYHYAFIALTELTCTEEDRDAEKPKVGQSFQLSSHPHAWDAEEVIVLAIKGSKYVCACAGSDADEWLAAAARKKPKITTGTFTADELVRA